MSHSPEEDENRSGPSQDTATGSVWTSFSDLFTSLAIIFLVMFIFALIKGSIATYNSLRAQQEHEKRLEGKIPKNEKRLATKRIHQLKNSLSEIQNYHQQIDQRKKELDALVLGLSKHKGLVKKLLEDQKSKSAVLANMSQVVENKNKKIRHSERVIAKLREELRRQSLVSNVRATEDASSLKSKESSITKLTQEIARKTAQIAQSKENAKQVRRALDETERRLDQTRKNHSLAEKKIKALLKVQTQDKESQDSRIARLQNALEEKNKLIKNSQSSYRELQKALRTQKRELKLATAIQGRSQATRKANKALLAELRAEIAERDEKITTIQAKNRDLNRNLKLKSALLTRASRTSRFKDSKSKNLVNQIEKSEARYENKISKLNADLEEQKELTQKLRSQLESRNRAIASKTGTQDILSELEASKAEVADLKRKLEVSQAHLDRVQNNPKVKRSSPPLSSGGIRSKIAGNVAKRLKGLNMNVTTNLKTGSITLFMDEAFFFVNDSAVLSEEVKKKLKVIVPIYADELFKDKTNRKLITSVNVIGHSSPRFDSRYVDPLQGDSVAYNYNLALSTNRAVEIVKYIFSNEFGDFDHASIFRSLTKASGKSYSNPIPLDRRRYPANSKELGQCGKYDCRRSRRVEISFSLREDTNQILRFFK